MLQPGDRIDIWVVDKALGAGGMGSVYRCHNAKASRILAAVKVLESAVRKHPESEARFIREAEILFSLDHQNIVKVRNVRTDTDPPYLEMEFVEGQSLEDILRRGPPPFELALSLMAQTASAIAYLHAKGVRHRDIKPSNLLVKDDGTLKLVDFGLAMEANTTRITQQGMAFGTVSYAPPEWITPDQLDPEMWDLYAMGVVFWEILTGDVAFPVSGQGSARQQAMQVIVGKQNAEPLDPGPNFRDDLRQLIRDLTHRDPSKRPQSSSDVIDRVAALEPSLAKTSGKTLTPPHLDRDEPLPPALLSNMNYTWAEGSAAPGANEPTVAQPPPEPEPPALDPPSNLPSNTETVPTTQPRTVGESGELPTMGLPTDHPSQELPAAPRRGPVVLLAGGGFMAGVLILVLLALLVGPYLLGGDTRSVDVAVTGLDPNTPVDLRFGTTAPISSEGFVFHFKELFIGEAEITWAVGERCSATKCPGLGCPAWCGAKTEKVVVEPGEDTQKLILPLKPPTRRMVSLHLTDLEGDWPVSAELSDVPADVSEDGDLSFAEVLPGRYALMLAVGVCPADTQPCWPEGDCPTGCRLQRETVVVPWGEGEYTVETAIPTPEKRVAVAPRPNPSQVEPGPEPEPEPGSGSAGTSGQPVTNAQFAVWLQDHPDWHRGTAIEAKRADENYLQGWLDATPPAGQEGAAATNVSWWAANAYCKSRGGLADLEAEPQRWSEGPAAPYIEWRVKDGKTAAWRSSDGRDSDKVVGRQANGLTGFRCSR